MHARNLQLASLSLGEMLIFFGFKSHFLRQQTVDMTVQIHSRS